VPPFVRSAQVAAAQADGRPVVALESSIIAQGFPRPDNLALAQDLHAVVRASGAEPAMVALLDGALHIGLDEGQLRRLAREPAEKCSTRDLAPVLAAGGLGATTVAATARLAAAAGIAVFATGGIGGIHPGARLDVSADLFQLALSPVCVVASGAKSILDLPATLEALKALGVPVVGFRTDRFRHFTRRTAASS